MTRRTVTAVEAAEMLDLADSADPAAAARRKLSRRGVRPVDDRTPRRYWHDEVADAAIDNPPKPGRPRSVARGPFATLSFEEPIGEVRVDLSRLTPVARALAEVMEAQPLSGMARCDVVLEAREGNRSPAGTLGLPRRQTVRWWSVWRPGAQDIHAWLEYEASKLVGWVPIRPWQHRDHQWRAPSADAALAEDELLSRDQALAVIRAMGVRITMDEWFSGQRGGDVPAAAIHTDDRKPRWRRADIVDYALSCLPFTPESEP